MKVVITITAEIDDVADWTLAFGVEGAANIRRDVKEYIGTSVQGLRVWEEVEGEGRLAVSDLIIGLSGYARSGKNEAANALVERGWRQAGFADKLREFLYAVNPVIPAHYGAGNLRLRRLVDLAGWEYAKVTYPEVRALLQRTGMDAGRKVLGQDVWVDALLDQHADAPALVVTDVRFPNEAQAIADRGGILMRVERTGVGPSKDKYGRVHESEVALDDWDFDHRLSNDGSIADLHDKLAGVASLVEPNLLMA